MPASAEILIARDAHGETWLLRPGRDGEPKPINKADAERIIAEADFERFNRQFATWRELDDFRRAVVAERFPEVEIDFDMYTIERLRELLDVAREWASEGDGHHAHGLALDLLGARPTGESPEFRAEVRTFIESLEQPVLPPEALDAQAVTPLRLRGREIWRGIRDESLAVSA